MMFIRKLSLISISLWISQLTGVILIPFLTKKYPPALFGSFYFIMSISQLFCVILGLRIEWIIPKCSVKKANDLLLASFVCSFFLSLILLVCVYTFLPIQYKLYYYIPFFSFLFFFFPLKHFLFIITKKEIISLVRIFKFFKAFVFQLQR